MITWQKPTGFSRDPNAHPEWAAAIWSGARAALLTQRHRDDDIYAGALHTQPGTVVAFRTDALYLTAAQQVWPYNHQPGDYLLRATSPARWPAPTTEAELLALRDSRTHRPDPERGRGLMPPAPAATVPPNKAS